MTDPTPQPSQPSGRRSVLAMVAMVAFGLMLGISLDRFVLLPQQNVLLPPRIPGVELTPALRRVFVRKLGDELDLSDAQRDAVAALVEQQFPRIRAASDSARMVFERATREPRSEMMKILTPAQRQRFREITGALGGDSLSVTP